MSDEVNTPEDATENAISTRHAAKREAKSVAPNYVVDNDKTQPIASKETFSREYVSELREENKSWKQKYEKTLANLVQAKEEAQTSLSQFQQKAEERIIQAELKTHALQAGLIDVDDLKLADLSSVKLNDAGCVEGAQQLLEALKAAKPYLFAPEGKSSSYAQTPPTPKPSNIEPVKDLPRDAYERRKAIYLRAL